MPFITSIYNNAGPNFIDRGVEGYKTGLNMRAMSEERDFRKKKMLIDEETSKFNKYKSQLSLGSRLLNNVVDQSSYTQAIKDDQKMGTNVFRDADQTYDPAYIAKKKNAAMSMGERLAVGNQKISALKAGLMMGQEGEYIRDPQYQDPNQLGSLLKRAQLSELLAKPQIRESLRQTKTIQREEDLARQSGIRKEKFYSDEQKEKIAQRLKGFVPAGRDKDSGRLNYKRMKGSGKSAFKGYSIPGLVHDKKTKISKTELQKARLAITKKVPLLDNINKAQELIKSSSRVEWLDPGFRNTVNGYLSDAQLVYKGPEYAGLGVLTGPDVDILNKVIIDPFTMTGAWMGPDDVVKSLDRAKERIELKSSQYLSKFGFSEVGANKLIKSNKSNKVKTLKTNQIDWK